MKENDDLLEVSVLLPPGDHHFLVAGKDGNIYINPDAQTVSPPGCENVLTLNVINIPLRVDEIKLVAMKKEKV